MGGLDIAARRSREMAATGVDGLFTFEGPHDVFFPLVAACAGGPLDLDLMTNVAMAFPRSPLHMAHARLFGHHSIRRRPSSFGNFWHILMGFGRPSTRSGQTP